MATIQNKPFVYNFHRIITPLLYSVSQKIPPPRLKIFSRLLNTYYTFLSTLDYKFLLNYLQF